MENLGLYIYCIGSIIALIIGIIEIIKDAKNNVNNEPREYGMIVGMILLSWIFVGLYIYNHNFIKDKKLI